LIIPGSVTSLGNHAFEYCSGFSGSLIIPGSVISIGNEAFAYCGGFTSVTIPGSVTSIGDAVFASCNKLTDLYVNSSTPINLSSSYNVFYDVPTSTCKLYVPAGSKSAYQEANQWKDFKNIIELTTSLSSISNSNIKIAVDKGLLFIENVDPGSLVQVYTISGVKFIEKQVDSNNTIILLTAGTYILRIGDYSDKVVVK